MIVCVMADSRPHKARTITTAEAADILGCSVWTVHRHIRAGLLDGRRRAGTAYLLDRHEVEQLAEQIAALSGTVTSPTLGGDAA
jgi:excisionase family DNA binding protein